MEIPPPKRNMGNLTLGVGAFFFFPIFFSYKRMIREGLLNRTVLATVIDLLENWLEDNTSLSTFIIFLK